MAEIYHLYDREIHSSSTELYISEAGLNSSSAKIIEQGDLLLALYGATSGDIAISKIKGAINRGYPMYSNKS